MALTISRCRLLPNHDEKHGDCGNQQGSNDDKGRAITQSGHQKTGDNRAGGMADIENGAKGAHSGAVMPGLTVIGHHGGL